MLFLYFNDSCFLKLLATKSQGLGTISVQLFMLKKYKFDFKTNLGTATQLSNEACTFLLIGLPV